MEGAVLLRKNGSGQDWSMRMGNGERVLGQLRIDLNRLQADDEETRVRRTVLMNRLRERTLEMHAFLEDCLCGRNEFEKAMMRYKVRIEFSLYSHLDTIFALTPVPLA